MRETVYRSETVDISSADHTFATAINAIYVGTGGTVVARLRGDAADTTWVGAQTGSYLVGEFTVVRQTSTADNMIGCAYRGIQSA